MIDIPQLPQIRVSFVIADLEGGGTQRVVSVMANAWVHAGRDVTVITFSTPETDFFVLNSMVRRISLNGQRRSPSVFSALFANFVRLLRLRRAIRDNGAPVVVGFIGQTNVLLILAALGLDMRVVVCERNDLFRQSIGVPWDWCRRRFYPVADVVTTNSREVLNRMRAFIDPHKLAYLPNPLIVPPGNERDETVSSAVLAVGRLAWQKAYDVLIQAFALLQPEHPEWCLVILGEGEERQRLEDLMLNLNVDESVELRGRIADPFPIYRSAQIFVMPSRHEGMPNALIEAMSCGIAPIVSDATAGALEYVVHDVSGLVVPVDDAPALAAAIQRLIVDIPLRCRLGSEARKRVQGLSVEDVTPEWDRILGLSSGC